MSVLLEILECRTLLSGTISASLPNLSVDPGAAASSMDLGSSFNDPQVTGTAVVVDTSNGPIPMNLLNTAAPQTVANFLRYVNAGLFNGTVFDRSVSNFVDQGGAYRSDGSAISSFGTIPNEFNVPNTRGTVAMFKVAGDPNSASNQWFINENDNSGVLDSQNGGFTVFAQVIDNGMTVADAINALPTIDATELNSSLPGKPDDPLPVQDASGGVTPSNLVVIRSVKVAAPLSYAAVSDDSSVVTATIGLDGHSLLLSYPSGGTGVAHITVSATDLSGSTVSQRFRVNVGTIGDELDIKLGAGGAKTVSFKETSGATVTTSLKGPGSADLQLLGSNLQQSTGRNRIVNISGGAASVLGIAASSTTARSSLTFASKGSAHVAVGQMTFNSAIGSVVGPTVDLTGSLTAGGAIGSLLLHSISSAQNNRSVLSAPSIGKLSIRSNLSAAVINLTGAGLDLKSLNVAGAMQASEIHSAGSLGALTVGSTSDASILAGVTTLPNGQLLPNLASELAGNASIASVDVRGSFSATAIAAKSIGLLRLGRIQASGEPVPFGVAGSRFGSIAGTSGTTRKKFAIRKPLDQAKLDELVASLDIAEFAARLL
jgi:peptidyl-prolyl cis-trans isomerase A (cyclophilin A)